MKRSRFHTLVPYTLLFVLLFGLTAWKSIGDQPSFDHPEVKIVPTTSKSSIVSEPFDNGHFAPDKEIMALASENVVEKTDLPKGVEVYHTPLSSSSIFLLEFNELSPAVLSMNSHEAVVMNETLPNKDYGSERNSITLENPSSWLWPLEVSSSNAPLNLPVEEEKDLLWNEIKHFLDQNIYRDSLFWYTAGLKYNPRLSISRIKYVNQSRSSLTTDTKFKFISYPDPNNWIRDSMFIMVPANYKSKTLNKNILTKSFSGRDCVIYTCASRRGYKKPNLSKGNRSLGCPSGTSLRKLSTKEPLFTGKQKAIIVIPRYR